jgi:hypothetical protein
MATLVADCPHCGASHAAFPIVFTSIHPSKGREFFNVFGWCPACGGPYSAVIHSYLGGNDPKQFEGNVGRYNSGFTVKDFFPKQEISKSPLHVPKAAARAFVEGSGNLTDGRYTSAVAMFRRAIDIGTKQFSDEVTAWKLEKRIDKLCAEGLITKDMKTWAHKIRLEGNEAVHEIDEPTKEQAAELKLFTEMVLTYLYTLPEKVKANLPQEEPSAT